MINTNCSRTGVGTWPALIAALLFSGSAVAQTAPSNVSPERAAIFVYADQADNPSRAARERALQELSRWNDELGVGAVARFLNDKDPTLRHQALDFIGSQRSRSSVAYLSSVYRHPDETMRRDAIAWLEVQARADHRDEVAEALVPFLADPNKGLRLSAMAAVGETGHVSIVPQVARLYDVPDPELRLAAVDTLNHVWDKASADALVAFVDDADPRVRIATYQGLAQFGGRKSFELLVENGLNDSDPAVRASVVQAVADLRLGAAIGPLAARFETADLDEKKVLVEALAEIGTEDAQVALRELNERGDWVEQVIVAKVWAETREKVSAEREALAVMMTSDNIGAGETRIVVSIDPTVGVWIP